MAAPQDPYALQFPTSSLSPGEFQELDGWNFIRSHGTYKAKLVSQAQRAFTITCRTVRNVPGRDAVYEVYWKLLKYTDVYKQITNEKSHLPASLYEYYCKLLAKYVLLVDVDEVTAAPCS